MVVGRERKITVRFPQNMTNVEHQWTAHYAYTTHQSMSLYYTVSALLTEGQGVVGHR